MLGYLVEDRSDGFDGRDWNQDRDSRGEFDLDRVHGRLEGLDTQKNACLGRSSAFTLPLFIGSRRVADRLVELRDGSVGLFALGDTFGPNFGGFRGW